MPSLEANSPVKVLYLHPVGALGGASKSLIELFKQLKEKGVVGLVLTPFGKSSDAFREIGMEVREVKGLSQFDNTRYGHYRGLRWIILLRELLLFPFSCVGLWKLRKERFDLIHANEITLLPLGIFAKYLFNKPLVVHVRSLQCRPEAGWRARLINKLLANYADAVVAIDHTVASTLSAELPLRIVHNGINMVVRSVEEASQSSSTQSKAVCVGFLGVLIPLKGIFELIEAMRILKQRNVQIKCLVAGENARQIKGLRAWAFRKLGFAWDVRADLEKLISKYGLGGHVQLLGFVKDVHELYPRLDILCFPSYLDAAGRSVFEAALHGVPSVVAVSNPMPDAVLHGVTGLSIERPDPVLIADALQNLTENQEYREQLGRQARKWAKNEFSIQRSAQSVFEIYLKLISN
jgi:glycosyltransferase involved in cell wall biosynthesis